MSKWVEVIANIGIMYAVEIDDDETINDAVKYVNDSIIAGCVEINEKDCSVFEIKFEIENLRALADKELLK